MNNLVKTEVIEVLDVKDLPQSTVVASRSGHEFNFNFGSDCGCSDLAYVPQPTRERPAEAKPLHPAWLFVPGGLAIAGLFASSYLFYDHHYNSAEARLSRATVALEAAQAESSLIMAKARAAAISEGFVPDQIVENLCP